MSAVNRKNDASSEMWDAVENLRPKLRWALLFGVLAGLLHLVPTAYMFETYGRVVNSRSIETLLMLSLVVVVALALMEALEWVRSDVMHEAGNIFEQSMLPRVYQAMFRLNLQRAGAASSQPLMDLRTLKDFFSNPLLGAMAEVPVALLFLLLLFAFSWVLGLVALLSLFLQVALTWSNERQTQPGLAKANQMSATSLSQAHSMMRHAEVVKAMGMRKAIFSIWGDAQQKMLTAQGQASDSAGINQALTKFLQQVTGSGMLGVAAWLLLENALPGGAAMIIVGSVLAGRILAPLGLAVAHWRAVVNARESWKRLGSLLRQVDAIEQGMELPAPTGKLVAEGVVVIPPGAQAQVLRGLSFALNPGDALAVAGPSASGKSCLARVLVGVWPSVGGKVRLDGVDVYTWWKPELGRHVGYLPQDVELLDGTVAENIARFGDVDTAAVESAARMVGMHDWISSLPEGYDTPLGIEGARLSGGQRQRIGLARAVYRRPRLVVLDEPNSSLDEAGELALKDAILEMRGWGATVILISHRTNILQVCSHMLILTDGVQKAFGSVQDVLASMQKGGATPAQQLSVPVLTKGASA